MRNLVDIFCNTPLSGEVAYSLTRIVIILTRGCLYFLPRVYDAYYTELCVFYSVLIYLFDVVHLYISCSMLDAREQH